MVVPRLRTITNLRLQWGEWFAITLLSSLTVALAIEAVLQAGATVWFGDPARTLMPLAPLIVTLLAAAIALRLLDTVPRLQSLYRWGFALGVIITALTLIRLLIFPTLPAGDWSWLASFGQLTDLVAERPHAELGLMIISVIIWMIGERIVRNAGDYELRRQAFVWLFGIMIVAIVLGLFATQGNDAFSVSLALYLPIYVLLGLLMMAQVRLSDLRARMARAGGTDGRTLRIWRGVTLGLAFVTLVLVFFLTAIFYSGSYQGALNALGNIWGNFLDLLAIIIGFLTLPFVNLLAALFGNNLLSKAKGTNRKPLDGPQPPPIPASTLHVVYTVGIVVVLAIIVVILLVRARRRAALAGEEDYEEVREILPLGRAGRQGKPALALQTEAAPPAGTTRAVYRDFLRRGAQAGMPRDPEETPAEYAARVTPYLGMVGEQEVVPAVAQLTSAYADERYGATSPTSERFTWAQGLLQRIGKGLNHLGGILRAQVKKR